MISEDIVEDVGGAVKEIMKLEHVNTYDYHIEGKSESGDNYMGEVIFVKVIPEEDNTKTYNLVVKTSKRSEELRKKFPIELYYKRELFMYSEVFPSFRKLLEDKTNKIKFDFVPHMYWTDNTSGKETVVLDNLKCRGFKLHNRKKPWNIEHSHFIMKHYGKLHALSIALSEQKPELFEKLRHNLGTIALSWTQSFDMKRFIQEPFDYVMDLLRKKGRDDLVDKYYPLMDEINDLFENRTDEEDKVAICHMDCWNNNFLFKYKNEDETIPSEVRFLDFQLSLLDSPAKDLSYNIYATCDNTGLGHFDELLQTYQDSLRQSLETLGCDPNIKFLDKGEMQRHWRKYGTYGVFLSINLIKMQLLNEGDVPTLEELVRDNSMEDGFKIKMSNQEEYDRRILDVFLHFGDNFL